MTEMTIKSIKTRLEADVDITDAFLDRLRQDPRKGVEKLVKSWERKQEKQAELMAAFITRSQYEKNLHQKGYQFIAGIDEVGRGPLAGPVVASAVILPADCQLIELNDSKQLSKAKRESLFDQINEQAISVGVGIVDEKQIDVLNIYQATKLAMKQAVEQLSPAPDYLLLDAMVLESIKLPQEKLIKGDSKSISIAAASIIAKVTRDRLMVDYDVKYPGYGFAQNAGYGTKAHLDGLKKQGPCEIHRKTFAPVKEYF